MTTDVADVSETRPAAAVTAFVAEVRDRLSDLAPDERDDLVDGLEADLSEQLADGATGLLDDPASYAAELRAAAGLPAARRGLPSRDAVGRLLDDAREHWAAAVERDPGAARTWRFVATLRPAWWVLRAWVAVTLVDQVVGTYEPVTLVPSLVVPGLGILVLVAAVAGSVLLGQRVTGPDRLARTPGLARAALLVLNVVAVVGLVSLAQHDADSRNFVEDGYGRVTPAPGLSVDGRQVRNLYPYDAEGRPITTGVQLFDGEGRPVALTAEQAAGFFTLHTASGVVGCPWVNGTQRLWNVFPLPERDQRPGTVCQERLDARLGSGVLPDPPLAQVPPVSLPSAAPR